MLASHSTLGLRCPSSDDQSYKLGLAGVAATNASETPVSVNTASTADSSASLRPAAPDPSQPRLTGPLLNSTLLAQLSQLLFAQPSGLVV